MPRILIVDDEDSICWGLARLCQQMGIESESVSTAERGLELAKKSDFDVIIMDVRLPGIDGLAAIEHFHANVGRIPIITITAFGDLPTAIEAIQKGAFEYIVKPFELNKVRETISQALATARIIGSQSEETATRGVNGAVAPEKVRLGLVGSSVVMQELYKQIAFTTTNDSPVLLSGESGTGKELTARAIHKFGRRSSKAFVAVNIAALSSTLAESELFGHVKGAFTGADSDRIGLIQQAHGGTLFLDEIAEIPLEIQVKLLRVLDHNEVMPVGSNAPIPTDFRLISATNQNLLTQVNHGDFRHDLFYRLRTFEIQLPPLRERKSDIPELVQHFVHHHSTTPLSISSEFVDALRRRAWHGNIRELRSVVERAIAMARGGVLTADQVESLAERIPQSTSAPDNLEKNLKELVEDWTRQNWDSESTEDDSNLLYERLLALIEPAILPVAFELSDRQYSAAARRLGIHRTTLKKKLDEMENP